MQQLGGSISITWVYRVEPTEVPSNGLPDWAKDRICNLLFYGLRSEICRITAVFLIWHGAVIQKVTASFPRIFRHAYAVHPGAQLWCPPRSWATKVSKVLCPLRPGRLDFSGIHCRHLTTHRYFKPGKYSKLLLVHLEVVAPSTSDTRGLMGCLPTSPTAIPQLLVLQHAWDRNLPRHI